MTVFLFFLLNQLLLIVLLAINRLASLLRFGPEEIWRLYAKDILPAFERGFRFDAKVTAFLFLPLLIFTLINLFLKTPKAKEKLFSIAKNTALGLWIFSLITIMVDHQYYAFFQSHLTVLFFGIAEDDTAAVLKSMWTDHPVVRWLTLISIIYFGLCKLFDYFDAKRNRLYGNNFSLKKQIIIFAIYIPLHVLIMRGSLIMNPLRRDDATVSNHPFINYLVINPFFALKEALQEKSNSSTYLAEEAILKNYQQSSVEDALAKLEKKSWDDLYAISPKSVVLESKKPNVVYVMMESWSNFLFDYQSPDNDLMSSFAPHAKEDFLFRNVVSSMNSTLPAMEGMLLGKEIKDVLIWNSPFRFKAFPSSLAQIYKDKGYRTIFITSGKLGWRNLHQWIPKQGFDESYGENEILSRISDAKNCSWGVYDEYSFKLAEEFLSQKDERPIFMYVMTTSNHTPYEVPPQFKPAPNHIPAELTPTLTTSKELAEKSLIGFQYSNKSLGDFISYVKSTVTVKDKTVILAVGDHNSWMLAPRNSEVMSFKKTLSVPFYFYIPQYLRASIVFDPARTASHKDLISTLVPLTLSEAKYFDMGNNLFERSAPKNHFFGLNSDTELYRVWPMPGDDAAVMNDKARAYLAINHIYFQRELCKMQASWCRKP